MKLKFCVCFALYLNPTFHFLHFLIGVLN